MTVLKQYRLVKAQHLLRRSKKRNVPENVLEIALGLGFLDPAEYDVLMAIKRGNMPNIDCDTMKKKINDLKKKGIIVKKR